MTAFVQLIEYRTSHQDQIDEYVEAWRQRFPQMGPRRVSVCQDRTRPGHYVSILEFGSYEEAMRNSEDPATQEFSSYMQSMCDGPPVFHDLDVRRTEVRTEPSTVRHLV